MHTETRTTDAKARLVLPKSFANATVIVEFVSETEVRIRRAKVVAEDDLLFAEESASPLSDRDRDRFLELLAAPPAPTPALKKAAARHKARRG
ncbi:DUF1778 domain-containing protein [Fimbriiglobus ruber]|uniref:DUF1778 domain-containing protein n=1 Tax=Fimbriiglobus ruber TaxID=1908690 RepID=A0A225DFA6_9BACT|nr:DUF1778 domain-containing protein [Fimbriiglobus ruber]OWK36026.1 hypothetical protein FRUB_08589 [Fimbriiglobus ruber]